jgi:hypothetical protein
LVFYRSIKINKVLEDRMMDFYGMWLKQYFNALEFMTVKKEVNKQMNNTNLQTNDYVPFKDNGLDDVMRAWAVK